MYNFMCIEEVGIQFIYKHVKTCSFLINLEVTVQHK